MSRRNSQAQLSLPAILQGLGSPGSIDWRTHLLFLAPALLTGFAFDFVRLGGSFGLWFIVVVAGYWATVFGIKLLEGLFNKRFWSKSRPRLALLILFLAGMLRGLVIFGLGLWFGLFDKAELPYRVAGGAAFVIVSYVLFNLIVSEYLAGRRLIGDLENERNVLRFSRANFKHELDSIQQQQQARVRELIAPSIWELGKLLGDAKLSANATSAISVLKKLNDDIVRPLSHQLGSAAQIPDLAPDLKSPSKFGQFALPKTVMLGQMLPGGLLGIFIFVVGFSSQTVQVNFLQALINTATLTFGLILTLFLIAKATEKLVVPTLVGGLLSVLIGAFLGQLTGFFAKLDFISLSSAFTTQATIFFSVSVPTIFTLSVVQQQRAKTFGELRSTLDDLSVLTSQLRQQVWLGQRAIATDLHGSLQSALYAASMKLSQNPNPSSSDIEKIESDIHEALDRLGERDYLDGKTFEMQIQDLIEVWEGSSSITCELSEPILSILAKSPATARCVLEVIREATSNAIKHGQAKNIAIQVEPGEKLISLQVQNDGLPVSGVEPGFGTQIIAELTHSHGLLSNQDRTIFSALIPIID